MEILGFEYATKDKGHQYQDVNLASLWDPDRTACLSREDGIDRLHRTWGAYNHFCEIPDQFGIVPIADSFALPTGSSVPTEADGVVTPELGEAVPYV